MGKNEQRGRHAGGLLEVPSVGRELILRTIIRIESKGQGIAADRTEGVLLLPSRFRGKSEGRREG